MPREEALVAAASSGDWEKVLELSDSVSDSIESSIFVFWRAEALTKLGRLQEALEEIYSYVNRANLGEREGRTFTYQAAGIQILLKDYRSAAENLRKVVAMEIAAESEYLLNSARLLHAYCVSQYDGSRSDFIDDIPADYSEHFSWGEVKVADVKAQTQRR